MDIKKFKERIKEVNANDGVHIKVLSRIISQLLRTIS